MALGTQFLLLMWKNWTLQKRKVCVTVFEILLPLFFGANLMLLRMAVKPEYYANATIWKDINFTTSSYRIAGTQEILFVPDVNNIRDLMKEVQNSVNIQHPYSNKSIKGFGAERELLDYHNIHHDKIWGAVVFDTSQSYVSGLPQDVVYDLRVTVPNYQWETRQTYAYEQSTTPRTTYSADDGYPGYNDSGFIYLQYEVGKAIIKMKSGKNNFFDNINMRMKKMPYPPYVADPLLSAVQSSLPLYLILGFILYVVQLTKNIVYEKENKLKESMKMMGLSPVVYWMSWFMTALIYLLIVCLLFTVGLTVKITANGRVLPHSDPLLIFVFFFCFSTSVIALSFMISTFFMKANTALFAGGIIYFLTYFPYFFLSDDARFSEMTLGQKILACLLSNVAMAFGVKTMTAYEGTGEGVQWNNFYKQPTMDSNFTFLTSMLMMLADTVLYFVITWYIDAVKPGEYGVPEPFYFPFTKTYWCGSEKSEKYERQTSIVPLDPSFFEREPEDKEPGISINHLKKVFGSGKKKKVAVRDTTLNMYEGHITALLGHNGAGKTTTMSMLTGNIYSKPDTRSNLLFHCSAGLYPPTSGTAQVNGYDIRKDIASVRKNIGLCPQHNILFDTMTVEEHLYFYGKLKGCPAKSVNTEVNDMIKLLGLETMKSQQSITLSGGQKRKLSVGIALIAGSKTIILDEPTSGMDPAARRQTWDILQNFREGRTIVLSTHFMDEADLLGDRIAIMAEGVVKCCGTSYFLKKIYDAGYHLVMVKDKTCIVPNVTELVQSHVASASLESEISAELSYLLPFDESVNFEKLLLEIESKSTDLGISSFGATATTMEEVFLKVGTYGEVDDDKLDKKKPEMFENPTAVDGKSDKLDGNNVDSGDPCEGENEIPMLETTQENFISFNKDVQKNVGLMLIFQQFYGMFLKKVIHTLRNRLVTGVQLVVPVIFTIMALSIELSVPKRTDEPSLTLNLAKFGSGLTELFSTTGSNTSNLTTDISKRYVDLLKARGDNPANISGGQFDDSVISQSEAVGIATFNKKFIIGLDIISGPITLVTAYFNGQPYHSSAISMAYAMNAMLKSAMASNDHSITTRNFPFPLLISDDRSSSTVMVSFIMGFVVAFTTIFGMSFLIGSFIIFIIKERVNGAKHLQRVSGVGPGAFWISNFIWDMINYLVPVFLILVVFAAFNSDAFVKDHRLGLLFLMFLLFGWASLPFVYMIHFVFKSAPAGMVAISILNILSGLVTLIAVFVLKIPSLNTEEIGDALDVVFPILFPVYSLGSSIMNVYINYGFSEACKEKGYPYICLLVPESPCCPECPGSCIRFHENYLEWEYPGVGKYVFFMFIQGLLFFALLFVIDSGVIGRKITSCKTKSKKGSAQTDLGEAQPGAIVEDSDVATEREKINTADIKNLTASDSIVIKNLKKYYKNFLAVDEICVSIPEQECFGLLGQNGAGKTTTFKLLTGDEIPTSGNAWLNSHDILHNIKSVHKNLGYCPQFDALIDQMTGRETLTMFARLRGVIESQIKSVVVDLIDILMLRQYADKKCETYSGGNKRKLSTAIALIGDPQFIFLDEPTTGVDPEARRQLWNVLSQVRASGRTLVLTSHSMEECDALCTKIVIMVNGRFVCCGSSQHLKNKFGQGYTLICNMGSSVDGYGYNTASTEPLKAFLYSKFPSIRVFDDHQGYCHFQIMDKNVSLGLVFGAMEEAKKQFNVEDYAIHQATLEQVFLAFTRNQIIPANKTKDGICRKLCCCFSCCCK